MISLGGIDSLSTVGNGNIDLRDMLTEYDGVAITHDAIGNPLYDGEWTYTWEHGRELASMSQGSWMWEFTYDANGMRTRRTDGIMDYRYVYNGSQLTQLTVIETWDGYQSVNTLYFTYSADGTPLTVTSEGEIYFYVTNIQGDVIAILDHAGRVVCRYIYDAWGNVTTDSWLGGLVSEHNPLRYRGYVYDWETQLYYLQSRYYSPEQGRFLNADAFTATGQGVLGNNMFAYCQNNPMVFKDSTGYFLCTAIGAFVGGVCGALSAVIDGKTGDEFKASVLSGATAGAISGAAADILLVTGGSAAVVVGVMATAGAIGSVAGNVVESKVTNTPIDTKQTVKDAVWDGLHGGLFGYMGGAISSNLGNIAQKGIIKTIKKIVVKEVKELGSSIAEEFLEEATSSLSEFAVSVIKRMAIRFLK